ncbi:hypothetical protein BBP40_008797 [Aspergillus hancockii]|nr:hypothetical protein BBP40_008797 [Aspergillus hancockii]
MESTGSVTGYIEVEFYAPKKDHAVINVIPTSESQRQNEHLYSIVYFLRPEDAAQYKNNKGGILSARG